MCIKIMARNGHQRALNQLNKCFFAYFICGTALTCPLDDNHRGNIWGVRITKLCMGFWDTFYYILPCIFRLCMTLKVCDSRNLRHNDFVHGVKVQRGGGRFQFLHRCHCRNLTPIRPSRGPSFSSFHSFPPKTGFHPPLPDPPLSSSPPVITKTFGSGPGSQIASTRG